MRQQGLLILVIEMMPLLSSKKGLDKGDVGPCSELKLAKDIAALVYHLLNEKSLPRICTPAEWKEKKIED